MALDFSVDSLDGLPPQADLLDFFETSPLEQGACQDTVRETSKKDAERLERGGGCGESKGQLCKITHTPSFSRDGAGAGIIEKQTSSYSIDGSVDVYDEESSLDATRQSRPPHAESKLPTCSDSNDQRSRSISLSMPTTPKACNTNSVDVAHSLSPWERWVIQKAIQEKRKREKTRQSKAMQHAQELEILAKKEEKQTNSKRCFEEWVSKKATLERDRRKVQEQRQLDEATKEREKRQYVDSKASSMFKEWQVMKERERKREEQKRLEECRQREAGRSQQRAKGEDAYRRWLTAAGRRKIDMNYCTGMIDVPQTPPKPYPPIPPSGGNSAVWGRLGLRGPGGWNDADFIYTGGQGCSDNRPLKHCPGQTDTEYRTEFSMWCMMGSSLLIATDIRNMTDIMKEVLLNKEMIDINQDYPGKGGNRIGYWNCSGGQHDCQIWAKELHDGSHAIALYNAGAQTNSITFEFSLLNITSSVSLRDLWAHKDLGAFNKSFTASVVSHGAEVYKLKKL